MALCLVAWCGGGTNYDGAADARKRLRQEGGDRKWGSGRPTMPVDGGQEAAELALGEARGDQKSESCCYEAQAEYRITLMKSVNFGSKRGASMGKVRLDEVGIWSEVKLEIIRRYAVEYSIRYLSKQNIFVATFTSMDLPARFVATSQRQRAK